MAASHSLRLTFAGTALLFVAALVTACSAPPAPTASASASTAPSATPTPEPEPEPEATALEVSVDGVTLVDSAGDVVAEAGFDDGAGLVSFLGDALGSTPAGVPNAQGYPITFYDWGVMSASVVDEGPATMWIAAAATEDPGMETLELRTTEGVTVGMSRDDAIALGAAPAPSGLPDELRLQVREAPGTESLTTPGTVGVDFILVIVEGDAVVRMISPANDWGDL